MAWARAVLGVEGPYFRSVIPAVLAKAHDEHAATQLSSGLTQSVHYGAMWLGVPNALVAGFSGVAGVRPHRIVGGQYDLPVVEGVPVIPWRYARNSRTRIDWVRFGRPRSRYAGALFEHVDVPLELDFGERGFGDEVVGRLPSAARRELASHEAAITVPNADGGIAAVVAYASIPEALLRCHLGYAELKPDGFLRWHFREEFRLDHARLDHARLAAPARDRGMAFDTGEPEDLPLRHRTRRESAPVARPTARRDR
ncbi:hypothetical protein [Saccharothrix sp. HUAS TT1]|uniref:hypothetical protein n=1 Tax=unclassified Saccharothrix TaxID=2593673 RepID=UPI00345BD7CA